jgi:hypothetical protein
MRAEKKPAQKGGIHAGKPGVTAGSYGVARSKTDAQRHAAESSEIQGKAGPYNDTYPPVHRLGASPFDVKQHRSSRMCAASRAEREEAVGQISVGEHFGPWL